MKKTSRICGIICLIIAAALIGTAVFGHICRSSEAENAYTRASEKQKLISAHQTAAVKTAAATIKKAAAAQKSAQTAVTETEKTAKTVTALVSAYKSGDSSEALVKAILDANAKLSASDDTDAAEARSLLASSSDKYILDILNTQYSSAYKAVSDAESKLDSAFSGILGIYNACGLDYTAPAYEKTIKQNIKTFEDAEAAFSSLTQSASLLSNLADVSYSEAESAQSAANTVCASDSLTLSEQFILLIGNSPIGFTFTGFLFLIAALILLFWLAPFIKSWKNSSLFSTLMALLVMIIIQIYALGFNFSSYGEWGNSWLKNILNVLRSNSSNGMIALGMTFVIITGGIDLSVGSNLAGVATVVMVILDISANGKFTAMGLTGWPNYITAIAAGLLVGALLGALIGIGITKGRIPPFIFTLGVMEITRSVAQYFTRSFKTEVPKAFQVLANQEIIGGQMLLPIIYWLILAIIMYVISKHTAFGKHIYAVGSNERTSRLSGINVDRVKIKVYMLMGIIVAIAAITQVARLRGVDVASAGSGYEMNAIAAVVVGGTSMAGGRGSILGTVMGVLIIGIMNNLLVLLGIDAFLSNAFTGAIIIFAVLIQRKDKR